jgi:hypothetical protein
MLESGSVFSLDTIIGDDDTDTSLLREMAQEAARYIHSFEWCAQLKEGFFADGVGGIIGIFLFRADIAKLGNDRWIWVFVGDIPSAYLEVDDEYRSPQDALTRYLEGLTEWIAAHETGLSVDGLIPIICPSDPASLKDLAMRIETMRLNILPFISKSEFNSKAQSNKIH